ncbi:reverse transcriptase-like protein [Jeotgalibacillus sp. S-D1]|uniref:reverse transcriptase-like protein n=1 Tax=Jeotgalibacillus sp. S-D1 TaxID=2552189 RepID=UPI0014051F59|nr:reverse transcriptase-like protein [Jeotgalibacillus sp. S-D1]
MEVRIHFQYNHPKLPSVGLTSDWMAENDSLLFIKDLEKTGRMKELEIEDDLGQTWTLKEFKKLLEKTAEEKTNVKIEFDGSFNPATLEAGIGVVIHYSESGNLIRVRENAKLNGINSNNEAEYAALYKGMNLCAELGVSHQKIKIIGDSLVVINQLTGEWPCYEPALNQWIDKIESIGQKNMLVLDAKAVRRGDNKEADKLASQALEGISINSRNER